MKILTTPEAPTVDIALGKLVIAGAIFAPVAALLAFRNDCAGAPGSGRMALLAGSVAAGALAAFSCGVVARFEKPLKARHKRFPLMALGALGGVGLLSSALVIPLALRLAGASPGTAVNALLFVAILGFQNSFAILLFDSRRRRQNALATQARLRSLESQIRPHFFFNTLNTVSAFIPDQPEAAQAILARLAGMFRTMLSASETAIVPLSQELDFTREYLEIEQARFGSRLRYTLPRADETTGLLIPALTLQPIVENAVRHGIAKLPEGGHIRVELTRTSAAFQIVVTNPVEEIRDIMPHQLIKPGHSLEIVADRLRLLYKGKARIDADTGRDFRISLHIPGDGQCAR
jgi:hypothetical protein